MTQYNPACMVLLYFAVLAAPAFSQQIFSVCGNSKVLLVETTDPTDTIPRVIWEWDAHEATDIPVPYSEKYFERMDECKFTNAGKWLLVTSSAGGAGVLDIQTRKMLFYTQVTNAHSIEQLPGGRIVVAGSTGRGGNCLALYDMNDPERKVLYRDSIYSGHGVVWHPVRKRLFVLGYNTLKAYALSNWSTSTPSLRFVNSWELPERGGHDLQLGTNEGELVVTTVSGVWRFIIDEEEYAPFWPLARHNHIKSVSFAADTDQLLFVQAEETWWSHHVTIRSPHCKFSFPDLEVYKARWK